MQKPLAPVNYRTARKTYQDDKYLINQDNRIISYHPAYTITNESLRELTNLTFQAPKHVLTVAASGDQALFYRLRGADKIDTFDLTPCAKVIQDIKTTALKQNISHPNYMRLLNKLHLSRAIQHEPEMRKILPAMPTDTRNFIQNMNGLPILGYGGTPSDFDHHQPTPQEFEEIKQRINRPFKFIWSDVAELHTQLSPRDKYDIIYLSNIFDWSPALVLPTLHSLRPHIKRNGAIITLTSTMCKNTHAQYKLARHEIQTWANIFQSHAEMRHFWQTIIIHRTK